MEIECGGFTFFSNFDSGNLAKVEYVPKVRNEGTGKGGNSDGPEQVFKVWTRPDCAGTEFENGNRTWFYFGIRGGPPQTLIKLNIMNMNRQAKLYSQGMQPVYKIVPGRPHWERIKEKPTYAVDDKNFILSFEIRMPDNVESSLYVAFTYPYTYTELQSMLKTIDKRCEKYELLYSEIGSGDCIYYHRECVCYSLDRRRIDLITISSHHGITAEREVRLKDLFPEENVPRSFKFVNKKVVFVSARVHPGETPSSFVFNGFLNFILQEDDPIAVTLRKKYVFKLVPTLNPDGIARGHYRTDTRGVNLNRVYLNPSLVFHPSVYAARALIRYYHHGKEVEDIIEPEDDASHENQQYADLSSDLSSPDLNSSLISCDGSSAAPNKSLLDAPVSHLQAKSPFLEERKQRETSAALVQQMAAPGESSDAGKESNNALKEKNVDKCSTCNRIFCEISGEHHCIKRGNFSNVNESREDVQNALNVVGGRGENAEIFDESTRFSFTSPAVSDSTHMSVAPRKWPGSNFETWFIAADSDCSSSADCFSKQFANLNDSEDGVRSHFVPERNVSLPAKSSGKLEVRKDDSGLFLYVDLHGHASKKGIFMYGNHFEKLEDHVECMLLPKLMSLNCANFHFSACNFTERNMYLRDRHDGLSREGSGRVAMLKATGLIRSYTLECNYNTGRTVNMLPPCPRDMNKPPVQSYIVTPKYTPYIFEEVGRALAISILDLAGNNPWSRVPNSDFKSIFGLRASLREYCSSENFLSHKSSTQRSQKIISSQQQRKQGIASSSQVPSTIAMPQSMNPSFSLKAGRNASTSSCGVRTSKVWKAKGCHLGPLTSRLESKNALKNISGGCSEARSSKTLDMIPPMEKGEDSERKENLSSFSSQRPLTDFFQRTKVLTQPKENIGPSQSSSVIGRKKSQNPQTPGVLQQHQSLVVKSKCSVSKNNLRKAGGSVVSKVPRRPMGHVLKKEGPTMHLSSLESLPSVKKVNTQKGFPKNCSIRKKSGSSAQKLCSSVDSENACAGASCNKSGKGKLSKVGKLGGAIKSGNGKSVKDDVRLIGEQQVIKQGPKRLKIAQLKPSEQPPFCLPSDLGEDQRTDVISLLKQNLEESSFASLNKNKKPLAKLASIMSQHSKRPRSEIRSLSTNDLLSSWDVKSEPSFSRNSSRRSSVSYKKGSKITSRKLRVGSALVKPLIGSAKCRAVESKETADCSSSIAKQSTNTFKQGKSVVKSQHLSPIKGLQRSGSARKKGTDWSKKKGRVGLKNLPSVRHDEANPLANEKKRRKKPKCKFS